MKSLARIACLAALAASAAPALADVRTGVEAWTRGDWATAVREWQAPAAQGDADAQFNLGQAYKSGRGVTRDLARAEALFQAAAAQGHLQASDNLGLLLYQRGAHAAALPYLTAAAARGDPRAQYYMGIAHFNGEHAAKDWVRAYALVGIAQQAGLEAATRSLAEMDKLVPLDQRQKAVVLAGQITAEAEATRARQLAALDLGRGTPVITAAPTSGRLPSAGAADNSVTAPSQGTSPRAPAASPRTAGADYARPAAPAPQPPRSAPQAARPAVPVPTATASGAWRVQLGAFAVAANADALWARLKSRPELAGHPRVPDKGGKVTRLLAGGFATQDTAQAACRKLAAAGHSCLVTKN